MLKLSRRCSSNGRTPRCSTTTGWCMSHPCDRATAAWCRRPRTASVAASAPD
jgi:hypothetical protein